MEQDLSEHEVESKAIAIVDEEEGVNVPMMLTAFDGDGEELLEDAGYRGRYVLFAMIDGGVAEADHDPYGFDHWAISGDVLGAMNKIRRGWSTRGSDGIDWSDIEHGKEYKVGELHKMAV